MKCITPHTMRRGTENITVPCRRCMPCRVNHSQDWSFRIQQELKVSTSAYFITLTYSDKNITRNDCGNGILIKSDFQKFYKRLRITQQRHEADILEDLPQKFANVKPAPIRHYTCGEYGETTFRPHGHAIIFNLNHSSLIQIQDTWKQGHVYIGTVTPASIGYVTKYITKVDSRDLDLMDLTPPFNLMSQGLGRSYVTEATKKYHEHRDTLFSINREFRTRLPQYLQNKVHDLSDPLVVAKLKRAKQKMKYKMEQEDYDHFTSELAKGNDPFQEERDKNSAILAKLTRKKRNKL